MMLKPCYELWISDPRDDAVMTLFEPVSRTRKPLSWANASACAGSADRDRGGDRLRERLDYARPAHGVRGTLWQESVRAASQGHSRRRYHACAKSEELTKGVFSGAYSCNGCSCHPSFRGPGTVCNARSPCNQLKRCPHGLFLVES